MKEKRFQYSKILVSSVVLISLIGIFISIILAWIYQLDSTVACAAITLFGGIIATTVLFSLKKSQAENTVKIYLGAYKDILEMKKQYSEDSSELVNNLEMNVLGKVETTLNTSLDEATAPIEKQNVY
jgi:hypothetical protein